MGDKVVDRDIVHTGGCSTGGCSDDLNFEGSVESIKTESEDVDVDTDCSASSPKHGHHNHTKLRVNEHSEVVAETVDADDIQDVADRKQRVHENAVETLYPGARPRKLKSQLPFMCSVCFHAFHRIDELYSHFVIHPQFGNEHFHCCEDPGTIDASTQIYTCSLCLDVFPTLCMLEKHMLEYEKTDFVYDSAFKLGKSKNDSKMNRVGEIEEEDTINTSNSNQKPDTVFTSMSNGNLKENTVKTRMSNHKDDTVNTTKSNRKEGTVNTSKDWITETFNTDNVKIISCTNSSEDCVRYETNELRESYGSSVSCDLENDVNNTPGKHLETCVGTMSSTDIITDDSGEDGDGKMPNGKFVRKPIIDGAANVQQQWKLKVKLQAESHNESKDDLDNIDVGIERGDPQSQMIKPRQSVTPEKGPYKCERCGRSFKRSNFRKYPHRCDPDRTKYRCESCGKEFLTYYYLKHHRKIHTNDRSFQCPHCPMKFTINGILQAHLKRHEGIKPHQCAVCGKFFARAHDLTRHSKSHGATKDFTCKTCNKSFVFKNHLIIHEKIHLAVKPYICDVCGRGFVQRHGFKAHLATHGIVLQSQLLKDNLN